MAIKISQCFIPFFQQNKLKLTHVFDSHKYKNRVGNFSTNPEKKETHLLLNNIKKEKYEVGRNYSVLACCNDGSDENFAAVLCKENDLRVLTQPTPRPNPYQVLLQMEACGICGLDVHFYLEGKIGPWLLRDPLIMGHEASGTVLKCGKCVEGLQEGDKVAVEPQVPCGKCKYCRTGKYHMCPCLVFCAYPPHDGTQRRFYVHDANFCHKLPCTLDYEVGALLEPLSVAIHGCKKGHITSGDNVLIIGAGSVGICCLLAAKAYGASSVIIIDMYENRLRKAVDMGADCAMNIKGLQEDEIVRRIIEFACERPNKTIECSGHEKSYKIGISATRTCGKMVLIGLGKLHHNIPLAETIYREIDLRGAIRYNNDYATAIDMVKTCRVDPRPLITHHFKLEDAAKAYEMAANKKGEYVKIMIHPNPKWKPDSLCCC